MKIYSSSLFVEEEQEEEATLTIVCRCQGVIGSSKKHRPRHTRNRANQQPGHLFVAMDRFAYIRRCDTVLSAMMTCMEEREMND